MAIHNNDLDCQKCSEGVKKLRGCDGEVEAYYIEGEKYTRCPAKLVSNDTRICISVYNLIKSSRQLYNEGGIGDQANKLIEVLMLMNSELNKMEKYHV